MRAKRLHVSADQLVQPDSSAWRPVPREVLKLDPTPLTAQPSLYVQASWRDRRYGANVPLTAQAAHNGEWLFFRLSWADESEDQAIADTDQFADAAAVLFPLRKDAPLQGMGSPEQPVEAWYWRADLEEPLHVTAEGVGTTRRQEDPRLRASAAYADAGWAVVVGRRIRGDGRSVGRLGPGRSHKVAFAIWQGANQERGGLKAVTLEWQPLEIEA